MVKENLNAMATHQKINYNCNEKTHLKQTVAATFRAIASSPQTAHLGPVAMSDLARRRFKDKGLIRQQCA